MRSINTRFPPARARALAGAGLGFFIVTIDSTGVNIALPALGRDLGGSVADLQWTVDAYLIAFASLLLSAGALSDRLGARRCYALGLTAFTGASLVCGGAPSFAVLLASRLAQGAAAALLLPASLALVRQAYADPVERTRAVAIWTATGGVAAAAGPLAGGLLTGALGWRWIFFLNVPVGALGLALIAAAPRSLPRPSTVDVPGQVIAVLALAGLVFGVIEGGHAGFGSPLALAALGGAAVAAAAFVAVERRTPEPVLPPGLLAHPAVAALTITGFAINCYFYGLVFVLGLVFQQERGLSPTAAGVAFLPMTALITVMNLWSGRLAQRHGPRRPLLAGLGAVAVAVLPLLAIGPSTPTVLIAAMLVPVGMGSALVIPSMTSVLLDSVAAEKAGLAAGVLNAARQLGGAVGVAGYGVILVGAGSATGVRSCALVSVVLIVGAFIACLRGLRSATASGTVAGVVVTDCGSAPR